MGIFKIFAKKGSKGNQQGVQQQYLSDEYRAPPKKIAGFSPIEMCNMRRYGKAWLLYMSGYITEGLALFKELDKEGFMEATIALSMVCEDENTKNQLIKKAALSKTAEGLWKYCQLLPHSDRPDQNDDRDALWMKTCLDAAYDGSVDAMLECGNVMWRKERFVESMYWFATAYANDVRQAEESMKKLAFEWKANGCPRQIILNGQYFQNADHYVGIELLEYYSGNKPQLDTRELFTGTLAGVDLAIFYLGLAYEIQGNNITAYEKYEEGASLHRFPDVSYCIPYILRRSANMQLIGKGTTQDKREAIIKYQVAAQFGDRASMVIVGDATKETDPEMAAYWYGVSGVRGHESSFERLTELSILAQ